MAEMSEEERAFLTAMAETAVQAADELFRNGAMDTIKNGAVGEGVNVLRFIRVDGVPCNVTVQLQKAEDITDTDLSEVSGG